MKREEQVKAVCSMLSMSEKFDGEKIGFFVDEVKQYMLEAGVPLLLVNDRRAIGCIARGVADLYTYENGAASLSPYFKERVVQLKLNFGGAHCV